VIFIAVPNGGGTDGTQQQGANRKIGALSIFIVSRFDYDILNIIILRKRHIFIII